MHDTRRERVGQERALPFKGLFIGIDRYASPGIDWLSCARRDAPALHGFFTDTGLRNGSADRWAGEPRELIRAGWCEDPLGPVPRPWVKTIKSQICSKTYKGHESLLAKDVRPSLGKKILVSIKPLSRASVKRCRIVGSRLGWSKVFTGS